MRSWLVVLVLALLISGCARKADQYLAQMEDSIHELKPVERVARREFQSEMRMLLSAGQYARLAAIADSLRANRARFDDDHYALLDFLDAFSLTDTPQAKEADAWRASLDRLEGWRTASPRSTLPDVALAATYVNLAWKARGGGFACTVRDTGWAGFDSALNRARDALDDAATKRPLNLEWYLVKARVALGLGWTTEESQKLFEGAVAQDSTCEYAYWQRADYLLPRWYGEPGEWEAWLDRAVAPLSPDEADRVYAAVCTQMGHFHRDLFKESTVSWPRMWRGLKVQLERHPRSQVIPQEFAYNAALAGDVRTAHAMLERTGPRCDLEVWRSKQAFTGIYVWVQAHAAHVRTVAAN